MRKLKLLMFEKKSILNIWTRGLYNLMIPSSSKTVQLPADSVMFPVSVNRETREEVYGVSGHFHHFRGLGIRFSTCIRFCLLHFRGLVSDM